MITREELEREIDILRGQVQGITSVLAAVTEERDQLLGKRLTQEQMKALAFTQTHEAALKYWQQMYWELADRFDALDDVTEERDRLRAALQHIRGMAAIDSVETVALIDDALAAKAKEGE